MIEISSVTKSFETADGIYTAIDNISLTIYKQAVTVIKGASGSGKTTLLSIIGCMTRATSGKIILKGLDLPFSIDPVEDGINITSLPERFLTEIRRRYFGFIFQHFNLIKGVSALENIMIPAYPTGEPLSSIQERGLSLMEMFDITKHKEKAIDKLSGGELQRIAIARAMINNPEVIIADEPTAHLDSKLSAEFLNIVNILKSKGKTVIIASHDPIIYESNQADSVITMRDGKILE